MAEPQDELLEIADQLKDLAERTKVPEIDAPIDAVR